MALLLSFGVGITLSRASGGPHPGTHSNHWAFRPLSPPHVPFDKHPIDYLLTASQSKLGVTPRPRADARTLIRRAYFDLTGLPPSPNEVASFLKDSSPQAFARVVDRLLSSPHYGERWGRYWLDIARYADTKGYVFEEERRYPYSYTYRDYVIRSFNEDLPYNRFLLEQIAADRLELGEDKRPLAALGFLTLGRRFLNNIHDIIDDRMDVVFRGTMGVTIGCARCHDHKYDPVPIKDYYSLYGVFASSSEPSEKPLLGTNSLPSAYPEYVAERKKRTTELEEFRTKKTREVRDEVRNRTGDYLWTATETLSTGTESKVESAARERKLDPGITRQWRSKLKDSSWTNRMFIKTWLELTSVGTNDFISHLKRKTAEWQSSELASPIQRQLSISLESTNLGQGIQGVASVINALTKEVADNLPKDAVGNATLDLSTGRDRSSKTNQWHQGIVEILADPDSPTIVADGAVARLFDVPTAQRSRALQRKVEEFDATHPGAPPRAMALKENDSPHNPKVFIRGNPGNQGEAVPRRFLGFLSPGQSATFTKGGGRLELAEAIVSANNPLTPRVMVNRIWMYHFGSPLVKTPSDFGLRSDPPAQSELLDYLAIKFVSDDWSIKTLHRHIMLSEAYQRDSQEDTNSAVRDPANQTYWRMNRQRLDFEAGRDSLLAISGRLSPIQGGHSEEIATVPTSRRRGVYGFIDRQNLPGMFRTFDFANPDTSSSQRFATTVPQQALFLLNNPFIVEQAKSLMDRPDLRSASTLAERIKLMYIWALQRDPDNEELDLATRFLMGKNPLAETVPTKASAPHQKWVELAQAILVSNEVFFVD